MMPHRPSCKAESAVRITLESQPLSAPRTHTWRGRDAVGVFSRVRPPRAQVSKVDNHTFARQLSEEAGFAVGMFGKYPNNWPDVVPLGFDAWLANGGGGLHCALQFRAHGLEWAGIQNGNWQALQENYTTQVVVGNLSIAWIQGCCSGRGPAVCVHRAEVAHEPFIPAPWYLDHWDPSWPDHEPRPPSYNSSFAARADHHGNIATNPMLSAEAVAVTTGIFKNRRRHPDECGRPRRLRRWRGRRARRARTPPFSSSPWTTASPSASSTC